MARFLCDYECSIDLAYGFIPSSGGLVGHVRGLSIGNATFGKHQEFCTPTAANPKASKEARVGAISHISWDGNPTHAITIDFAVDGVNREALENVMNNEDETDKTAAIDFCIYAYDRMVDPGVWYEVFKTMNPATITGKIKKDGGEYMWFVAKEKDDRGDMDEGDQAEPIWDASITIIPVAYEHHLHYATSSTKKNVRDWGQANIVSRSAARMV